MGAQEAGRNRCSGGKHSWKLPGHLNHRDHRVHATVPDAHAHRAHAHVLLAASFKEYVASLLPVTCRVPVAAQRSSRANSSPHRR